MAAPLHSPQHIHGGLKKKGKSKLSIWIHYLQLFDTHTHTHKRTAVEMSEEVKDKANGKSANRKKKGKKVIEASSLALGL